MTHSARISLCLAAISLAALSACAQSSGDAPLTFDATSEAIASQVLKDDVSRAPLTFDELKEINNLYGIRVDAETYLWANVAPRYAMLVLTCNVDRKIKVDLGNYDLPQPDFNIGEVRIIVTKQSVIGGPHWNFSWQDPKIKVFFDEMLVTIPEEYKTITKQVDLGDGEIRIRSERHVIKTAEEVNDNIIVPKIRTSKTMRIQYAYGIGPSFDLIGLRDKIETLETQCASGGAQQ